MRMHLQAQSEMHLNLKLLIIYSLYFDRDVKNLIFLVFCPWVMEFCQKKGFLLYVSNTRLQSEFIQVQTESYCYLKTAKQLSATNKSDLKHIGHINKSTQCT